MPCTAGDMRARTFGLAGAAVVTAAAGAVLIGQSRWRSTTADAVSSLHSSTPDGPDTVDLNRETADLPRVVACYFRATLRDGQRVIAGARVTWRGEFNMGKPGRDNWRPFSAEQEFSPSAPGFVWNARIRMAPGVPVLVRDGFVDGQGQMRGAIFGLVPVVNAPPSPALSSGALQRYLGEAAWLPTALLPSQRVSWSPLDNSRARATITAGDTTVSLEFTFDDEGRLMRVYTPERMMDDGSGHAEPHEWEARILTHESRDGMIVNGSSVAAWLLPSGRFEYWRGAPVDIRYTYR